jgi:hypothetical protein
MSSAEPIQHHVRIARDGKGRLCFVSSIQAVSGLTEVAVVDIGRPFHHHVSSVGKGPSGLVIEGLDSKEPRNATVLGSRSQRSHRYRQPRMPPR